MAARKSRLASLWCHRWCTSAGSLSLLPPPFFSLPTTHEHVVITQQHQLPSTLLLQLFSPGTFSRLFYAVLFPPVIFNAGFTLKQKDFVKNIGSIFTYAFLGTIIATVVLSLAIYGINKWLRLVDLDFIESLMFGALLSPIDTVATISVLTEMNVIPMLYSLVFGESVLNDAVAIALCTALAPYVGKKPQWSTLGKISKDFAIIVLGSVAVGALIGYFAAFVCHLFPTLVFCCCSISTLSFDFSSVFLSLSSISSRQEKKSTTFPSHSSPCRSSSWPTSLGSSQSTLKSLVSSLSLSVLWS